MILSNLWYFCFFYMKPLPSLISDATMLIDEHGDKRGKIAICPCAFKNNDCEALTF